MPGSIVDGKPTDVKKPVAVKESDSPASIAPEKLLRALLLQGLYSVRSERLLMEQLDYNLLFRWFVGLSMDDPVWDATVYSKNQEQLLEADIAQAFFEQVVRLARQHVLLPERALYGGRHVDRSLGGAEEFQEERSEPRAAGGRCGQSQRRFSWRET